MVVSVIGALQELEIDVSFIEKTRQRANRRSRDNQINGKVRDSFGSIADFDNNI